MFVLPNRSKAASFIIRWANRNGKVISSLDGVVCLPLHTVRTYVPTHDLIVSNLNRQDILGCEPFDQKDAIFPPTEMNPTNDTSSCTNTIYKRPSNQATTRYYQLEERGSQGRNEWGRFSSNERGWKTLLNFAHKDPPFLISQISNTGRGAMDENKKQRVL